MKIALVVGGSGMLAALTKKLSLEFDVVGVIGRNHDRLAEIADESNKIVPISVDYSDTGSLRSELGKFTTTHGIPDLIVSWIHSTAPEATLVLAEYGEHDFYEVTGEAGKNDNHVSRKHAQAILKMGLDYHRVTLGRIGDRWLTNSEISTGVYRAIKEAMGEFIVGE